MSEPLSASVVGAGAGGTLSIDALLASEHFTLTAVADMSEAALARVTEKTGGAVAVYTSAEEMFAGWPTDVVCVSTYAPTHLPLTRAALAIPGIRGLLVEKPLGDTTAAGAEILGLIKDAGLPVVVPHGIMAQAAGLEVVDRVRAGDIGTLRVVEMECTNWDIINAGIHWLQFFVSLTGGEQVEFVLAAADRSTRTFRDGMQVETDAITMARTSSHIRMLMHTGDHVPMSRNDTVCLFRIIGDHGFIEYGAYEPYYTVVTPGRDRERVDVAPFEVSGHQRHLEFLARQIHAGENDYAIPDSSLQALEIVEAAYESARVGGTVLLPIAGEQPARVDDWNPGAPYSGTGGGRNGRELLMAARIGIIGSSWRGQYFLRAASLMPERFEVTRVLVRSDASAAKVTADWNVPSTTSLDDFVAETFDFVVVATPPDEAPALTTRLALAGHAVLTETPPAPSRERLFALYGDLRDTRVQVAEQYRFQAHHAARLALLASGRLGTVTSTRMSVAHGYHGVSMIRAVLSAGFEPVTVTGFARPDPTVASRGRDDWHEELIEYTSGRTFATLDYADRYGRYEFDFEQYFSPIRPRHIEVYGTRGQLLDDTVSYVVGARHATTGQLQRTATGADGDLEGFFPDSIAWGDDILWANPFRGARLNDDEIAVAELMRRMADYAQGGDAVYPLADGCHDQLLSLAINEAAETGKPVRVDDVPWAGQRSVLEP